MPYLWRPSSPRSARTKLLVAALMLLLVAAMPFAALAHVVGVKMDPYMSYGGVATWHIHDGYANQECGGDYDIQFYSWFGQVEPDWLYLLDVETNFSVYSGQATMGGIQIWSYDRLLFEDWGRFGITFYEGARALTDGVETPVWNWFYYGDELVVDTHTYPGYPDNSSLLCHNVDSQVMYR